MATKHEVLQAHLSKWLACKGNKKERGLFTEQLSKLLEIHPKSVSRSMKRLQLKRKSCENKRGRPKTYGADVDAALCSIWEAMEYPCAENITRELIDEYIFHFTKECKWNYSDDVTDKILTMSMGSKKLRIASFRKKRMMTRGKTSTVSSPLKGMIPIRKSHTWNNLPPGYLQTDTVVHCGDILTGNVVYSVGCVDFATYWSDYTAQWNKGEGATKISLETIRERFPFQWKELHPDTGNEFINYHVHRWATSNGIDMTRSEPYKKNDNMCIEERNNSIARKHLGYARIDNESLVSLASEVLKLACVLHNHFRPVRRMISKTREGAKWKRTFEKDSKTPYQRLLLRDDISSEIKEQIKAEHNKLNPLEIKRKLDILKQELGRKLDRLKKEKQLNL